MIFKLCFVLCVFALKNVACFECPSVTEAMAKTCINDDPKCSAVPIENAVNCFSGCEIKCSDTDDETRCASPTEADVESCNNFGDILCSSFGIVEEEKGRRCFKGCAVMCSKK